MSIKSNTITTRNYLELETMILSLIKDESNFYANLSNILAAIKQTFNWLWVGIYKVEGEELVLFMFQGPHACTRIKKGKGVCGTAWKENKTLLVKNVHQFKNHITCNGASASELVIPIRDNKGEVIYVLDVDSTSYNDFSKKDADGLQKIVSIIEQLI